MKEDKIIWEDFKMGDKNALSRFIIKMLISFIDTGRNSPLTMNW